MDERQDAPLEWRAPTRLGVVMFENVLAAEPPAFARAVTAIVTGDVEALRKELAADPALVRARSASPHRCTLLHYVAANGIEDELQRQVPNADAIAQVLLAAGAEADALCDLYGGQWNTTMDLLVSSDHPCEAGVTDKLVRVLLDHGAAIEGPRDDGSPLATALAFGILDGAEALLARGARADNPIFAGAAGNLHWLNAWLDRSVSIGDRPLPEHPRLASDTASLTEQALVFAAMCGRFQAVQLLLDRGANVNASPPGSHWTFTPLHTAAIQGQVEVVRLLLKRGADPKIRDTRHQGTALDWTDHARGPRRVHALAAARILRL